jgi:hypothetical protein
MNKRTRLAGALVVVAGLFHWSCCGCDDEPTTPTVIATPTPTPTPTPVACTAGRFPDVFRCAAEPPPRFQAIVIAAQDTVRREHPEIFDGNGRVSATIYTGWLAQTLVRQGHCAIGGTDDEISIKPLGSTEFSELYDVVTGNGDVWNNYIFTCRPSLF